MCRPQTDGGGFAPPSVCEQCSSLSFSQEWFTAFGVALCPQCKRDEQLISKGNAQSRYLLTEKDLRGLGFLAKDNPQKKGWTSMKLYLKAQVMERARTKHGELEAIEEKKHSKVQAKLQERLAAKRRAPGEGGDGADGEGAGAEDVPGEPPPPPAGVAARVRARLTSEYEQRPGREAAGDGADCEAEEF